ncbi:hypothetical protein CYY_002639 [Polysphondylium violaceum]|uniref:Uncharacterized protein n=1 Tax=Polysphondylium violaceum TaxID=133409 RepID=A0A8J4PYI7_9MYCE|nr:hypothetical protein CYY_002639 [Polysphondylium violaceum]
MSNSLIEWFGSTQSSPNNNNNNNNNNKNNAITTITDTSTPLLNDVYIAMRDGVVSSIFFLILMIVSHFIIRRFIRRKDVLKKVYIPRLLCTVCLSVSLAAMLLIPITILSNEIITTFPSSYYTQWLNRDLIFSFWNKIFWGANISLFIILPFTYFFYESEGIKGRSLLSRIKDALLVLLLVSVIFIGFVFIVFGLIFDTQSQVSQNQKESGRISSIINLVGSDYLPFSFSLISTCGTILVLFCIPRGFNRLTIKSMSIRISTPVDDEIKAAEMEIETITETLNRALEARLIDEKFLNKKKKDNQSFISSLTGSNSSGGSSSSNKKNIKKNNSNNNLVGNGHVNTNLSDKESSSTILLQQNENVDKEDTTTTAGSSTSPSTTSSATAITASATESKDTEDSNSNSSSSSSSNNSSPTFTASGTSTNTSPTLNSAKPTTTTNTSSFKMSIEELTKLRDTRDELSSTIILISKPKFFSSNIMRKLVSLLLTIINLAMTGWIEFKVFIHLIKKLFEFITPSSWTSAASARLDEAYDFSTYSSKLGPFESLFETTMIIYLMIAAFIGFFNLPYFNHIRPKIHSTSLRKMIINTALILLMSSSFPVVVRNLEISRFDLMGYYSHTNYLRSDMVKLCYRVTFIFLIVQSIIQFFSPPRLSQRKPIQTNTSKHPFIRSILNLFSQFIANTTTSANVNHQDTRVPLPHSISLLEIPSTPPLSSSSSGNSGSGNNNINNDYNLISPPGTVTTKNSSPIFSIILKSKHPTFTSSPLGNSSGGIGNALSSSGSTINLANSLTKSPNLRSSSSSLSHSPSKSSLYALSNDLSSSNNNNNTLSTTSTSSTSTSSIFSFLSGKRFFQKEKKE